jgi:hypothetical protein
MPNIMAIQGGGAAAIHHLQHELGGGDDIDVTGLVGAGAAATIESRTSDYTADVANVGKVWMRTDITVPTVKTVVLSNGVYSVEEFLGPIYAVGGTESTSGGYKIHKFTSTGTFVVQGTGTIEVLVVAAGGGSTGNRSGGGGGGGALYNAAYDIVRSLQTIVVTIGQGVTGANGQNSVFGTMTAVGGGAGQGGGVAGNPGGSGGGGGIANAAGGAGTAGQGHDGGAGAATGAGGGGGGGGGDGGGAGASVSGTGGVGYTSSISGASVEYGSGGSGGGNASYTAGAVTGGGGIGKVGSPTTKLIGDPGVANTGGGGGGNSDYATNNGGTSIGGTGIVIVRYPIP